MITPNDLQELLKPVLINLEEEIDNEIIFQSFRRTGKQLVNMLNLSHFTEASWRDLRDKYQESWIVSQEVILERNEFVLYLVEFKNKE